MPYLHYVGSYPYLSWPLQNLEFETKWPPAAKYKLDKHIFFQYPIRNGELL